jgi:chemotaxis protein histidine kinase CheA
VDSKLMQDQDIIRDFLVEGHENLSRLELEIVQFEKHPKDAAADEEVVEIHSVADANIRAGVALLDKLMDLVGELVLTRNQLLQFNGARADAALNATSQRLNLIIAELEERVMTMRMQTTGMVWNNPPRVVRDVAPAPGQPSPP